MTGHPLSLTNRCVVFVCAVLLTVYCFLPTAVAQSTTATLTGTVEDQNGAVIPGVSITIQNTATSFERQT
ncbi:MAG TPA: carboxypeptidase-like regulatory domain-containing protein, partial [Pyrinomonadaceae bacterium]